MPEPAGIIRTYRSPNASDRGGPVPSVLVVHADADASVTQSIQWCLTPGGPKNGNPVSYHYVIGRQGTIYELVNPDRSAWAVGVSDFQNLGIRGPKGPCLNRVSVSISFGNRNDGIEPYTAEAIAAGVSLAGWLMGRYPTIVPSRIVTHAAVALPFGRKTDPGPLFPLDHFIAMAGAARPAAA